MCLWTVAKHGRTIKVIMGTLRPSPFICGLIGYLYQSAGLCGHLNLDLFGYEGGGRILCVSAVPWLEDLCSGVRGQGWVHNISSVTGRTINVQIGDT